MAVSYVTGPRGACHLKGDYYGVELGGTVPELQVVPGDKFQVEGKAESAARFQHFRELFDALLVCKFAPLTLTQISEYMNHVTGWGLTVDDLGKAGERSLNLKRAISNRLGVTREHDGLTRINLTALAEGNTDGRSPDMEALLREYYAFRSWDWKTGKPTRGKLLELGLKEAAEELGRELLARAISSILASRSHYSITAKCFDSQSQRRIFKRRMIGSAHSIRRSLMAEGSTWS